ncbi:MAG: CoA transferase [Deltaproteobacteria bacterium]|nr:CoA transferase [Deltaproteobacteria bacterium]
MAGALDGIRVIDFTHALNGPFCTMLLGHLGAEVIKVEPPGGDAFRRSWMPPEAGVDGYEFMMVNPNKKSIVINLRAQQGVDLARRLITLSDVLVENYFPGTMERFGLDYESVRSLNPRLIYASSRGYGDSGPYSRYGSNAAVNNAISGWTYKAWEYSGRPGTKALGVGDEVGGVSLAVGILAALYTRERAGEGQRIEVSMQEALLGFMTSTWHEHFTGNQVSGKGIVELADGYFNFPSRIPEMSDENWRRLAVFIGREELTQDPRFATAEARNKNRTELDRLVRASVRDKTRKEVWEGLRDLGYWGAPVLSISEVLSDEHLNARKAYVKDPYRYPAGITAHRSAYG